MTEKERKKIIKAIDYFLSDDPDEWVNGINELYLLVYQKKWEEQSNGETITIQSLITSIRAKGNLRGRYDR